MSSYPEKVIQLLAQLGFPEERLKQGDWHVQHCTHSDLLVSLVEHGTSFRLKYVGPRNPNDPVIRTRTISAANRYWEKSVTRWYQGAVLALSDMKRKKEDAETLVKQEHERLLTTINDLIPAGVDVTAEELHSFVPMRVREEGVLESAQYYNAVKLHLNGVTAGELVSLLARLKVFLKKENIPHH